MRSTRKESKLIIRAVLNLVVVIADHEGCNNAGRHDATDA